MSTYASELSSIGTAADTQVATLTQQLATAEAALALAQTTDAATIAALQAQVATLTAELAAASTPPVVIVPPPPPPPPPTGIVFVDNDFSGAGTFSQVVAPLQGPGAIVPSPDGSGRSCVRFISPASGATSYLTYKFANNGALTTHHPNGIFARFAFCYDSTALANAARNGQFKHWLSRYLDWDMTPGATQPPALEGLMGGVGTAFYGEGGVIPNQLVVIDDTNTSTIPQSATGVILQPNVFQRVQYWLSRDPVAKMGHAKMWAWNGTSYDLKVDYSAAHMFRDTDGTLDHLYLMLGDSYSSVAGLAYLADVKIADFFITD